MRLRHSNERGSAVVEFALVFPVFFAVVVGSLSLLWMLTARSALSGAARDGARYASIRHDPLCEIPTDPYSRSCAYDWPTEDEVTSVVEDRAGIFAVDDVELVRPTQPNETLTVTVHGKLPALFRPVAQLFDLDSMDYTAEAKAKSE
jgi:hypothetical protein